MTGPTDQETWRNRFIAINLVRIGATLVALLGIVIWHSDWWRQGGAMEIGFPLALAGVLGSFLLPRWMARKWRTPRL